MSSVSRDAEPGTLIVWVPHWAATVRLKDNDYHSVATLSPQGATGQPPFNVEVSLQPGVYSVEVELGATTDSEWVSVRSNKRTEIPVDRWAALQLASPMPIDASSRGAAQAAQAPAANASEAETWSRSTTWTSSRPGGSRLFVFVRTPDTKKYPDFAKGLSLLDQSALNLTRLADEAVNVDATAGWLAFCADLAGGFYILQREGPGPFSYNQPLYLSDGWETQVFLAGGNGPSFRSLTLNMAPRGRGFHRDDETAAAVDAVLAALRRESAISTVVESSHLKRLLHAEDKNPWLAVLAAYALTVAEDDSRRSYANPAVASGDPALKKDILDFLRQTLGSHPDVRALCLTPDVPAAEPFPFPPLMRIGLERVRQHATRFATTIPLESLTERVMTRQVTSSLWSMWSEPSRVARDAAAQRDAAPAPAGVAPLDSTPPAVDLGASAPVFRAPGSPRSLASRTAELRQTLYDLPVIKAAKQMIGEVGPGLDKIVVNSRAAAEKLLSEIEPHALSVAASIPLGRAQQVLAQLKAGVDGSDTTGLRGSRTERAVLRYALRQGSRGAESGPDIARPARTGGVDDTFEEAVSALRSAAGQLSAVTADSKSDPVLIDRSKQLAARLTHVADSLLGRADLIALTDAKGRFLYANGAFMLLMASSGDNDVTPGCQKWSDWLTTLPPGRSSGLKSPVDTVERSWTVRRIEVEDEATHTTVLVNILEDERWSPLSAAAVEEMSAALSSITLHASFVQYGSTTKKVAASLEKLGALAGQLESSVAITGGAQ